MGARDGPFEGAFVGVFDGIFVGPREGLAVGRAVRTIGVLLGRTELLGVTEGPIEK